MKSITERIKQKVTIKPVTDGLPCQLEFTSGLPTPVGFVICELLKKEGYLHLVLLSRCKKCRGVDKEGIAKLLDQLVRIKEARSVPSTGRSEKDTQSNQELNLLDRVKGVLGAFHRLKEKGLTSPDSYCSKSVITERTVCCHTCTTHSSCPFCGCKLKIKRFLATESCPSSKTYPHLRKFPARNFWQVCNETTSVIIASANEPYLNQTIDNLFANATGKIEVIVVLDGWYGAVDPRARVLMNDIHRGKKISCNRGAVIATGEYLFIVDAHCTMSYGWDTKLKCTCDDRTLVATAIKPLDPEKLPELQIKENAEKGCGYCHVYLNKDLRERWSHKKPVKPVEELMALTGCGWMIRKDYYDKLGGFDERLGHYGGDGPDWALKVWLSKDYPGRLLLRSDVICGHLFGSNKGNKLYPIKMIGEKAYREILSSTYGEDRIRWLVDKFAPVPTWDNTSENKEVVNNGPNSN